MVTESKGVFTDKHKWILISVLLFLFYISEGYSKYLELTIDQNSALPRWIKLAAMVFFLGFMALKRKYNQLVQILVLLIIFFIGQQSLHSENSFNQNIIIVLGRYVYPIILFYFISTLKLNQVVRHKIFVAFETLMVINSSLILLGFLFDIQLFETYDGRRFGYNGLFLTSAMSSYVYMITLFYFFLKIKQKQSFKTITFYYILFCSLFIGTKTIFIFIYILSLYFILNFFKKRKRLILLGLTTFVIVIMGYFILYHSNSILNELRVQKGLLPTILSFRNKLLVRDTLPYIQENWNLLNYFFGGVEDIKIRSEMGFIDVFFFFGILGGLYYLIIYFKSFMTFKVDLNILLFFVVLIFTVFFAGNFFFYSTIPIYLVLFRERIKEYIHTQSQD